MNNPEQTVGEIIDGCAIAFVSSVDDQGFPNTKAMLSPRARQGLRHIYFTTNTSCMRVRQFGTNPKACIYFCDSAFFRGVMLTGTMQVVPNKAARRLYWVKNEQEFYAQGIGDPDYCVLHFVAEKGRYYSDFRSENFLVDARGTVHSAAKLWEREPVGQA